MKCTCWFCSQGKEHKHTIEYAWYSIGSTLKPGKDESLDPNDRVYLEACALCGHTREVTKDVR